MDCAGKDKSVYLDCDIQKIHRRGRHSRSEFNRWMEVDKKVNDYFQAYLWTFHLSAHSPHTMYLVNV